MLGLLLAGAIALQGSDAQRFDLACEGERRNIRPNATTIETVKYRLKFDLAEGRWCKDECAGVGTILSISADRIVMVDSEGTVLRDRTRDSSWIDRVRGLHHEFSSLTSGSWGIGHSQEARCERLPFSGMPSVKF